MVNKMKRVGYVLAAAAAILLALPAAQSLAASASLYLSPSSGSVIGGSTITLGIRENSGSTEVNAVQANLSYPANLFDVTAVNSSSAFNIVAENSYGNGSIKIGRGALPAVKGDQLVASVTFTAKTTSGTARVSFVSGSEVDSASNNTNILSSKSGGNYTLVAAPSPSSSSNSPSGGSVVKPDTTPPRISTIKVSATANRATVSWTTSEPATSEVDYGLNNGYGLTAIGGKLVTEHKLTLSSPVIEPATTYHFRVKSTDQAGNTAAGSDSTFKTQGGILNATVVNQAGKPVASATVSFADTSAITDKNGNAQLNSLPSGVLQGSVTYKGAKFAETVNIKSADPSKPQSAKFQISTSAGHWWFYLLGLILLLGVLAFWFFRRSRSTGQLQTGVDSISLARAASVPPTLPDDPSQPTPPVQIPPSEPPSDDPF